MRKIILIMSVFLVAACSITEVKPYLKPAEVDIPNRIAEQQKWLEQYVASKVIPFEEANPIKDKLKKVKDNYDRLQAAGGPTAKDSREINRMLDQTSELIFRAAQKRKQKTYNY
ncbi:MAG: hypothetical protein ACLQVJ_13345 [Syntrophobacteraceae bacterium]